MGLVELVAADVGQTDVVTQLGIEVVELQSAAEAQSAVESPEGIVGEGAVGVALVGLLDVAADARRAIDAEEGLDAGQGVEVVLVFHQERHLEIVQTVVVGIVGSALPTFLYVGQSRLEIERRGGSQLESGHHPHVESRLRRPSVQIAVVGIDGSHAQSDAESEVAVKSRTVTRGSGVVAPVGGGDGARVGAPHILCH